MLWGILLQFGLGLLILRWRPGYRACQWLGDQVAVFLGYTDNGAKFVFGEETYLDHPVVFKVLYHVALVHPENYEEICFNYLNKESGLMATSGLDISF